MTDGAKMLIKWLSDNVLKAYHEPVYEKTELPYISLAYSESDWSDSTNQQITIWSRKDSTYSEAFGYADTLSDLIGTAGVLLSNDDCKLYITKGSPFAQPLMDDTKTIRAVVVNLNIKLYN